MNRSQKRLSIISVYVIIIMLISGCVWWNSRPLPTCIDGKKNGNETQVDCGGSCGECAQEIFAKDLVVSESHVVYGGQDRYDVVARIKNPNPLYGARQFDYVIELIKGGVVLTQVTDSAFILPNQDRYIVGLNIPSDTAPDDVRVSILNTGWVSFASFDDPNFRVDNVRFGKVEQGSNYAEVFGTINNESLFDFQDVQAVIIMRDPRGIPIALNARSEQDFDSGANRDFKAPWPYQFPGEISRADVYVYVDVFDSQNYVRKYLPEGGFESLRSL